MNRFLNFVLIGIPTAEAVGWLHPVEAVGFSFTFELCYFRLVRINSNFTLTNILFGITEEHQKAGAYYSIELLSKL